MGFTFCGKRLHEGSGKPDDHNVECGDVDVVVVENGDDADDADDDDVDDVDAHQHRIKATMAMLRKKKNQNNTTILRQMMK